MSGIEGNLTSSPFIIQALNNDIVVEEIISHLGPNVHDLIKYRLVCHKWNDLIVPKINKSGPSLHIPLRYGPESQQIITKSNARRWAQEILENISITLTGTASRLLFDTVLVDHDFYLAGVVLKWKQFLEAHGESIRHLKFKNRRREFPKPSENHVSDCDEIVSMKDLSTFSATPNLESLYFCIRFSNYSSGPGTQLKPKPIALGNLPILHKLTNITIREPKGISYSDILLRQILGMAPNLTSLCIKPSSLLTTHAATMNSMDQEGIQSLSLTSLKISNALLHDFEHDPWDMISFPYINLTTLELNNISGLARAYCIKRILLAHHSSLIKLILGDRKNSLPLVKDEDITGNMDGLSFVHFIRVMEHLKFLEMNLTKFLIFTVHNSYQIQFPVLECLTLSGARENGNEWTLDHIGAFLQIRSGEAGRSLTLKHFSLIGPIQKSNQSKIIMAAQMTFPMAECHFHSESDNQCARLMRGDL